MSNPVKTMSEVMNIPWAKPFIGGNERAYLNDALDSTWISGGPYVERFEKEFAQRIGAPYGITVSNGTTALQLALLALDIDKDDEVIVPGFTFVAPVNMVLQAGAKPVYADIDPQTWCIDPRSIEEKVSPKTKAIMAVHVYGNVCAMDEIQKIARKHKLFIIEDTAEAAFSTYKDQCAGTLSDIGTFSFQATKTISMGEGGFVATKNKELHDKMRIIRDHGMKKDKRYWHDMIGYNFRLTNLQAAVGCAQLERADFFIRERKRIYERYVEELGNVGGITLQQFNKDIKPVVWAFALRMDPTFFKGNRDDLIRFLKEKGIETRPGFYTFGSMPLYRAPVLKVAQDVADHVISLPFYPQLTEEEISFVCRRFKEFTK